jgi:large subunit ribosomal protein L25
MSDRISIAAEPRSAIGKKSKKLRASGWIPAVVYGQQENVNIQVENLALRRVLREAGSTSLIEISFGDEARTVLAKDIQVHPTKRDLIHVDFYEVNMKEKLVVEAALIATGIATPVAEGLGSTTLVLHALEIECLPDNLISEIEVDLSRIQTPEDVITVSDLTVPADVEILAEPDALVVRFDYIIEEEEEEEEEEEFLFADGAEEVEVISKGKQEEEEIED